ncbi:MAG: hypothetical protein A2151_09560 [Candidatus Muproteobacteria bacterium RBG_16_65_34]|uniref:Divergent polysaccharide deacetylase n=1 Tax=Candidatus Muproteobacteria bacterium RBG_16_65_34 TaxID=1817760 RepID=A0A1F6TMF1_9PROT|nr:MAG: hypothetical protein A2151_09560 [Candidatus Muproteobacteria bacterium RBG_16_65_34]
MRGARWAAVALSCGLLPAAAAENPAAPPPAYIAVVIDDLGYSLREGARVLKLPGPVACAILPHTLYGARLAERAQALGKEVILHLPLEAPADHEAGPGQIDTAMPARELAATLAYDLASIPHAAGVSSHMGSVFTQREPAVRALMQAIKARGGLFFIDSLTSADSVAARIAAESGVPYLVRDVFLDSERTSTAIAQRLQEIERRARTRGTALAIGHPYPETLEALERWLPGLAARHIQLVPLSVMLKRRSPEEAHGDRTRSAGPGL